MAVTGIQLEFKFKGKGWKVSLKQQLNPREDKDSGLWEETREPYTEPQRLNINGQENKRNQKREKDWLQ